MWWGHSAAQLDCHYHLTMLDRNHIISKAIHITVQCSEYLASAAFLSTLRADWELLLLYCLYSFKDKKNATGRLFFFRFLFKKLNLVLTALRGISPPLSLLLRVSPLYARNTIKIHFKHEANEGKTIKSMVIPFKSYKHSSTWSWDFTLTRISDGHTDSAKKPTMPPSIVLFSVRFIRICLVDRFSIRNIRLNLSLNY